MPTECLQNKTVIIFLTVLYNKCFISGMVPAIWKKNIIVPISKGSATVKTEPKTYRGLHLIPSICKVYCDLLKNRLTKWSNATEQLVDEQNGFRQKRGCLDHLFVLSNVVQEHIKRQRTCSICKIRLTYVLLSTIYHQGLECPRY